MAFFNEFPHTRTYDSDLGWIIVELKKVINELETYTENTDANTEEIETLKTQVEYLIAQLQRPIETWNAANTYSAYTLVDYQGAVYMAIKDVPVGVGIGDTDYWTPSGNVLEIITQMQLDLNNQRAAIDTIENTIAQMDSDRFYLSSLGSAPTVSEIQTAINDHNIIVFDIDIDLGIDTLTVQSNKEIYSINGAIISGSGVIFDMTGDLTDTGITAIINDASNVTLSAPLSNNDRYLFRDETDASTYGYPYFVGTHTANSNPPHYGFFTNIIGSGTAVRLTDTYAGPLSQNVKIYKFSPVNNVKIHDITIRSTYADETGGIINIMRARNIKISNVISVKGYGFNVVAQESEHIKIENCTFRDDTDTATQFYHLNVIRMGGVINGVVSHCSAIGTQPIDLTYSSSDYLNIITAFVTVTDNAVFGTQTGITTHPGTFACRILNNYIYSNGDGIALRGTLHECAGNFLYYRGDYANDYGIGSVAGCLCMDIHDNQILRFPIAFLVSEDANNPFSNSGTPYILIRDNFIQATAQCYVIDITGTATYRMLNADFSGNSFNGLSTITATPRRFLYIRGAGTSMAQHINILKNQINNVTFNDALIKRDSGSARRINIEIFSTYSAGLDNSYSGTITQAALAIYGTATIITTGTKIPAFTNLNA